MTAKGSVRRNSDQRAHVYEAFQQEEKTKRQLVGDLMQRAFAGSAKALVLAALKSGISKKERDEIEQLLKGGDEQ
jgi:predicted transcriptional regulator